MLGPSSFGFWPEPRWGLSVSTPYPEPLSISPRCDLLLPGSHFEAGGVEYGGARGPAAAPSRHTHYYAAAFPHALRSAFALEPNAVARPAGETVRHNRRTTTTTNEQQTRKATDSSGRATGNTATEQSGKATAEESTGRQKQEKQKTPAQQTTVQEVAAAGVRGGPRPTPPSACITHAVRKGIGRSPGGTPATSSLGPPEVRVGFRTAPQTIRRGEGAQVAIRRGEANGTTPLGELRL